MVLPRWNLLCRQQLEPQLPFQIAGEHDVLHHRQLNVTVIIFNGASLSLIKPKQGERHGGHGDIGDSAISFAGAASAMGMESATARSRSGLTTSLEAPPDRPY
jgi:thiamine pyrophosphate-dependent acetolactate synthase large subunit-like protein